MKKLIFATGNNNKMREIREIFAGAGYEILSMKEAGIEVDIVEDAETFAGNALIKARAVKKAVNEAGISDAIVLADDSGLTIDALNGEPGIHSARFMGEDTPYEVKFAAILEKLKGLKGRERSATFHCVMACVYDDGSEVTVEGTLDGIIAEKPAGSNGFGYDPILYIPEKGCTTAQMTAEEKNAISHRGKAIRLMREKI